MPEKICAYYPTRVLVSSEATAGKLLKDLNLGINDRSEVANGTGGVEDLINFFSFHFYFFSCVYLHLYTVW